MITAQVTLITAPIQVKASVLNSIKTSVKLPVMLGSTEPGSVENSDASYTESVSGSLVLPDETVRIYVNGVLKATGIRPPLSGQSVTITT